MRDDQLYYKYKGYAYTVKQNEDGSYRVSFVDLVPKQIMAELNWWFNGHIITGDHKRGNVK